MPFDGRRLATNSQLKDPVSCSSHVPSELFFEFRKDHFSQNGLFGKGSFYFCLGDYDWN